MKKGFLHNFYQHNGRVLGTALLVILTFWIGVLIILPQLSMLDYSLREYLPSGQVGEYTLKNYRHLVYGAEGASDPYNYVDLKVFTRTIVAAICVTIFNLLLCYPIAFFLGQVAKGMKLRIFAMLLIIPYWINEILRAFALKIIFGATGMINAVLIGMGILDEPFDFIRADIALYAGLGYAYILLMVFPMYNVIESLDHNQIEAARDLGAPWWRIHWRIVVPYAKPGISSGCTMVFMLSAGALAAPQILGGPSSLWFTQIIYQWFNDGGNWSQGAAYAIVLLVSCIIIVLAIMKMFKVNMGDIGK